MYCGERRNGQIIRGHMGLVGNLETSGEEKPSSAKASFRGFSIIRVMKWLLVLYLREEIERMATEYREVRW